MNRKDRRSAANKGPTKPTTLKSWLERPDHIVRRGDMPDVVYALVRIERLDRKRRRWYWRLIRKIRGED